MLQLRSISLYQFKNYGNRSFDFDQKIVGICGSNGAGKTNLLDAIHYLCFTKSHFSNTDIFNVQHHSKGFRIEGIFNKNGVQEKAVCILRENNRKEFSVDERLYDKFSQHMGRYPCGVIAPDDATLITGGSEERRSFADVVLSLLDTEYLHQLILYNKRLQQRNSFLKSAAETNYTDEDLLDVLDTQLADPGHFIFEKRSQFLVSFLSGVKRLYTEIAQKEENLSLLYDSRLFEVKFDELLRATRSKDLLLQRTTTGPHKDDLIFELNKQLFKNIASQGQRKSLLFALKLTELEVITTEKKLTPLLLLDDVFEKLDEDRINNLLQRVCIENDGQVFITDTNSERLTKHLNALSIPFQLIEIT